MPDILKSDAWKHFSGRFPNYFDVSFQDCDVTWRLCCKGPSSSPIQQTLGGDRGQACIEAAEPCSSSNAEYFVEANADAQTASGRARARDREHPATSMYGHSWSCRQIPGRVRVGYGCWWTSFCSSTRRAVFEPQAISCITDFVDRPRSSRTQRPTTWKEELTKIIDSLNSSGKAEFELNYSWKLYDDSLLLSHGVKSSRENLQLFLEGTRTSGRDLPLRHCNFCRTPVNWISTRQKCAARRTGDIRVQQASKDLQTSTCCCRINPWRKTTLVPNPLICWADVIISLFYAPGRVRAPSDFVCNGLCGSAVFESYTDTRDMERRTHKNYWFS